MTTIIAKTYVIPEIIAHRATCAGEQYTVQTPDYLDTVTVNGARVTCTCHNGHCDHIRAVLRRRSVEAKADANRVAYEATFDLSYGDAA